MSDKKTNLSPIDNLQPTEKSLSALINDYKDRLMKRASDELRKTTPDKQEQFLMRLISEIVKNENLKDCFITYQGKVSIYMLIDNCLKTGLMLNQHCYAVPYSRKIKDGKGIETWVKEASFQIKRQGYHALLCGGEKPIFKNLLWGVVYEKEKNNIKINRATGEVDHPISIEADRGLPIGCWVQAIKLDDKKEAEFYPITYIHQIRDAHSKTYQDYLVKIEEYNQKKLNYKPTCVWIDDPIPMIEKTAIKAFCRPYADVKEELANAYYSDNDEEIPMGKKSNSEIADIMIDSAIENYDKEMNRDTKEEKEPEFHEPEIKKNPEEKKETKKTLF